VEVMIIHFCGTQQDLQWQTVQYTITCNDQCVERVLHTSFYSTKSSVSCLCYNSILFITKFHCFTVTFWYLVIWPDQAHNLIDIILEFMKIQGGSNMTGTNCDLFTHKSSRSYFNHLELKIVTECFPSVSIWTQMNEKNTDVSAIYSTIMAFSTSHRF
jgi:hypothetical protein